MRRALLFLENVTAPSETAGAQGYVRPAGRVSETSPREPRRAGSRLLANKGARAGSGEGQGWRPGGVRARQRGAGRGERGKAEYRGVQAQEAGAQLAAAVAHARRLAGPGTSFARRVRGDSQGGALAQTKGARRRGLSQLPCGPLGRLLSPGNFGAPQPEARGGRGSGRGAEGAGGRRGGRGQAGSGGGGSLCRWNPQREANGQSHDNRQSNAHQCHLPKGTASPPPPAASAPTRPRARMRLQGTQATQRGAGLAPYPGLGTPGGRERLGWALTLALFARDANMFTNVMCAAFPPSTPPLPAGRLPGPPMAPFQTPVPVAIFCLV